MEKSVVSLVARGRHLRWQLGQQHRGTWKFWLQGHREDCCNKLSETGGPGLGGQCGEGSETQGGHTHTTESDVLLG